MSSLSYNVQKKVTDALASYRNAQAVAKEEEDNLKKAQREVVDAAKAQVIIQESAKAVQQEAHKRISAIVTRCLRAVFEDPYEFVIRFESKRGKTDAVLTFVRDKEEFDPLLAAGGGVVDVAAFALRLACLVLKTPKQRRVIVMDEPFKFVSERKEYRARVAELLETLAKEMNIQFITVTHDRALQVGKVVEL